MTGVRRTRTRPRYFQALSLCHPSPSRYATQRPTADGFREPQEWGVDSPRGWLPPASPAPSISVPLSQTHLYASCEGSLISCIASREYVA